MIVIFNTMDKKIITILIILITLINITAAVFIFWNIQIFQTPDTTIEIQIKR